MSEFQRGETVIYTGAGTRYPVKSLIGKTGRIVRFDNWRWQYSVAFPHRQTNAYVSETDLSRKPPHREW